MSGVLQPERVTQIAQQHAFEFAFCDVEVHLSIKANVNALYITRHTLIRKADIILGKCRCRGL